MRVLGLSPVAGRAFTNEEEKPGSTPVAMISEGLWKRRFGADHSLIGRAFALNGQATTIVGIAPAALSLISAAEVYTPLTIDPAKRSPPASCRRGARPKSIPWWRCATSEKTK
jgi:hypothetical protein